MGTDICLKNRTDVAAALLDMIRPLKKHYSAGGAWLHLGYTTAHYGEKSSRMEGFSRVLWGLGPLFAGDNTRLPAELQAECEEWLLLYRNGLIHGTDPTHEEYWGTVADFDQKMVEMAALATAICVAPGKLWTPLTDAQKDNVYQWMNQINIQQVHPNNWRFFRILVNMTFRLLGLPWSEACMKNDFQIIENCYTKDGWYYDGNPGQVDYYIPFAMHYYGLIYAGFMKEIEPERSACLMERAQAFSKTFLYWFGNDGNEIPFGRSLTYRFAHSAFFSAMAFAEVEGPGYGVMKHMVLKNLETWLKRPIFDTAGILSIGYGYPNLNMSERYNAPGSPYWAFKVFLMLMLPEEHPFWAAEEEDYDFEPQKLLESPHMIVTHDKDNHVMAFVAGQHGKNFGYSPEKYEKFVYSNQFGFSVPRGHGLEEGAFDNTLAISLAGDDHYRMRWGVKTFCVQEDFLYMNYQMMPKVTVDSWIVPLAPWHVRIHRIYTEVDIDIADGGFAIEAEPCFQVIPGADSGKYDASMIKKTADSLKAVFPWGTSGVISYTGGCCELVTAFPNTNLLHNLTVIPTVKAMLQAGEHLVITGFLGDRSENAGAWAETPPVVAVENGKVNIDGKVVIKTDRY